MNIARRKEEEPRVKIRIHLCIPEPKKACLERDFLVDFVRSSVDSGICADRH